MIVSLAKPYRPILAKRPLRGRRNNGRPVDSAPLAHPVYVRSIALSGEGLHSGPFRIVVRTTSRNGKVWQGRLDSIRQVGLLRDRCLRQGSRFEVIVG